MITDDDDDDMDDDYDDANDDDDDEGEEDDGNDDDYGQPYFGIKDYSSSYIPKILKVSVTGYCILRHNEVLTVGIMDLVFGYASTSDIVR